MCWQWTLGLLGWASCSRKAWRWETCRKTDRERERHKTAWKTGHTVIILNAYFVNLCFPDSKLSLHGVHFLLFLWSGTTSIQWYDCTVVSAEADRCCRLNNGLQCLTLNLQSEISGSISQSLKDRELLGCCMFRDDVYLIFSAMQQIIASEWPHRPNLCFLLSHPPLFSLCFFQAFDRRRLKSRSHLEGLRQSTF